MPNRNPCKQWFLTFPKSDTVSKEQLRDFIREMKHNYSYYKIVKETHQDGSPHLHAIFVLGKAISKSKLLKRLKETFPDDNKRIDVKPIRSITKSDTYLSKEDSCPLLSGEYKDPRNPIKNTHNKFARELGYESVAHLLDSHKRDSESRDVLAKRYWSMLGEMKSLYNVPEEQYLNEIIFPEISYAEEKSIKKLLFTKKTILKDDITNILKNI